MEDLGTFSVDYARSLGASYAEARIQRETGNTVILKNGNPEFSAFGDQVGIGVRVLANGALGFAATNRLEKSNLRRVVESALKMARASSDLVKKRIRMSEARAFRDRYEVKAKRDAESVSVEDKLHLLLEADKALVKDGKGALSARLLQLGDEVTEKTYVNSDGASIISIVPRVSFFYALTAIVKGIGTAQRLSQLGESKGWEAVEGWDLPTHLSREGSILVNILGKAKKPPEGEVDLVLGSEVVGIICHESCGHPCEADRILGREAAQAGESFVKQDMLGTRIGSESVTIVDDPTLPDSYGFYLYDEEGVKAGRRELIKNGIFTNFLHNRETAAEMGTESNGSARSVAYNREPIVRMANTYMQPGDHRFEELLEGIKEGVYIKTFMEWNIDDKRFNERYVGLEAYKVRNGELGELVRNPILEITTPGLYHSVDAVSKNVGYSAASCGKGDPMQGIPVYTGGGEVRLRKVRLGGSTI
ncbi:MAG TPA: TldD/PmbA family protein [Candidatus Bathyarchaeia archaeon]|nr:TldD/PmbA family protein [Candidatus Bathyarchaeia archaeon]